MPDENDLVEIDRFIFLPDAEIARTTLEAAGIDAVLAGEHTVRMAWGEASAHGGVRLQVRRRDAEHAREVLRDAAAVREFDGYEGDESESERRNDYTREAPPPACRRCGSEEVFPAVSKVKVFAQALVGGMAAMLLLNLGTCAGALAGYEPPAALFTSAAVVVGALPIVAVLAAAFNRRVRCRNCEAEWSGEQRTN